MHSDVHLKSTILSTATIMSSFSARIIWHKCENGNFLSLCRSIVQLYCRAENSINLEFIKLFIKLKIYLNTKQLEFSLCKHNESCDEIIALKVLSEISERLQKTLPNHEKALPTFIKNSTFFLTMLMMFHIHTLKIHTV